MMEDHQAVLAFWFEEVEPSQWWRKDPDFDALVRRRFAALHAAATRSELEEWRSQASGCLAEIILLDQFSRNLFRDTARAFAYDGMALTLAQCAVARELDGRLPVEQRAFLYMPYMHSESALIHRQAVELFDQPGLERNLEFELKHKDIIDRFGRYPHRNVLLGRESTPAEQEFLQQKGSSF